MRRMKMVWVASAVTCLMAAPAVAERVTLSTEGGGVTISGDLLEFDGETFFVSTSIGQLRLSAVDVICEGPGCPVIEDPLGFTVSGTAELTNDVFVRLLTSYAAQAGASLTDTIEGTTRTFVTSPADGADDATISVTTQSSAAALQNLILGDSDLALTIRSARRDEEAKLRAAGVNALQEHILGIGGLVIVTPVENPVSSISVRDAARVFAGEIKNWAELGGPDASINIYTQTGNAAVTEIFHDLVLDPFGLTLNDDAQGIKTSAQLDASVAGDPFAIGFKRFSADGNARQMPIIGQCGLVVSPTAFNIKAEEYPLSYRLMAITREEEQSELLASLLGYLHSGGVQDGLASKGAISQELGRSAIDQQGMRFASALRSNKVVDAIPRLQQMVAEMVVSERLSATFRFEAGSRELDERAQSDIKRVAKLLNAERAAGSQKIVRILGFTDSLGASELNQELSERRAQQVHDALLAVDPTLADNVEFRPIGFGDVSPIACDQSVRGRWVNRRVEIWISGAAK